EGRVELFLIPRRVPFGIGARLKIPQPLRPGRFVGGFPIGSLLYRTGRKGREIGEGDTVRSRVVTIAVGSRARIEGMRRTRFGDTGHDNIGPRERKKAPHPFRDDVSGTGCRNANGSDLTVPLETESQIPLVAV